MTAHTIIPRRGIVQVLPLVYSPQHREGGIKGSQRHSGVVRACRREHSRDVVKQEVEDSCVVADKSGTILKRAAISGSM